MSKTRIGFVVIESCDDYEQVLTVIEGDGLPVGGILSWSDKRHERVVFAEREDAKQAIQRTEHYRLAFGRADLPDKQFCSIHPVRLVASLSSSAGTKPQIS